MSMMQPNPGVVSGVGANSKRTDLPSQGSMKLPNAAYGEQQDFQQIQGGAAMAKSKDISAGVIPLNAETRRPGEFVTEGVNRGPGAGAEILGLPNQDQTRSEDLTMLAKYMPLMATFADSAESTGTTKAFIKYLRSQVQ